MTTKSVAADGRDKGMRGGYDTMDLTRTLRDAGIISRTLEKIDDRAICADGPVTPTLREATPEELRRIYAAAKRIQKRYAR